MQYAVVDTETNIVSNIIMWDGESKFKLDEKYILVESFEAGAGDLYIKDKGEFLRPLNNLKLPVSEEDKKEKERLYQEAKERLKQAIVFEDELN